MAALGSLPPWISVSPSDFLHATQAGAQLGTQIAENAQRQWEAQQRMRLESEAQNAKLQQFTMEQAAQRLAADRLEQYRQAEIANRQQELGLKGQHYGDITQHFADVDADRAANIDLAKARLNKPQIKTGPRGEILSVGPDGQVSVIRKGEDPTDYEQRDYERQLRQAQSALDLAKRNVSKFGATHPVENTGILDKLTSGFGLIHPVPKTITQVPTFPPEKLDEAKAAMDAAQNMLDEKQSLLRDYKKSKSKSLPSGVTHTYDPTTGTLMPVNPDEQQEY